jgi:hypothetical protein
MPENTSDSAASVAAHIRREGYAFVSAAASHSLLGLPPGGVGLVAGSWARLPRDAHLRDGGHYRARRHSCFIQTLTPATEASLTQVPHRAHWQPVTYNALHGGIERWFEPIETTTLAAPVWDRLLVGLGRLFGELRPVDRWFIEAHQFRIDTEGGIGRPTPEGAHRDGVDFVAVILIDRVRVRGGETHVFDASGPHGVRFTIAEPGSMLLMDDLRVIHETTPIQPDGGDGRRDTLVLTYRAGGFQAPG